MKLKASHIAVGVLAALVAFIAYAVLRGPSGSTRTDTALPATLPPKDKAFLEEIHQRQAAEDITKGVGSQMPDEAKGLDGPNIFVEHAEVDLGTVPNSGPSTHPFKIRNTGAMTLQVHQVNASCDCTKGIIPATGLDIPPGGEANMDILITPNRIPGFEATRYLTINSNDPDTPSLKLTVTSHVEPEFETDPREVDFGIVDKGTPLEAKVRLRQLREEPLVLEDVNSHGGRPDADIPSGELQFSYAPVPEAEWKTPGKIEYDIDIKISPEAPSGKLVYRVFLKTNVARMAYFAVMTRAIIETPYELSPRNPDPLGLASDGKTAVTATLRGKGPISVDNLQFDPEKLTVTVRPGENPDVVYLDAVAAPTAPGGVLKDLLRFNVNYDGKTYPDSITVRGQIVGKALADAAAALPESAAVTLDAPAPVEPANP